MSIGLPGAVFITFLILKLTEVIDWSWFWVTAPLWISVAIGLPIVLIAGVVSAWTTKKANTECRGGEIPYRRRP